MNVTNKNYLTIQGWMRSALNLKGNELLAYALIYGFTQDGDRWYDGGLQYMADWIGVSNKQRIREILQRLIDADFIEKESVMISGVTFCRYRPKSHTVAVKAIPPVAEKATNNNVLSKDSTTIEDNILLKENNNSSLLPPIVPQKDKRFVRPTLEQVAEYCTERSNNIDPQRFIDYYESVGWHVGKNPMKDWKAAVRTWERKDVKPQNNFAYGDKNNRPSDSGNLSGNKARNYDFSF